MSPKGEARTGLSSESNELRSAPLKWDANEMVTVSFYV